jgi:hypothetical protein
MASADREIVDCGEQQLGRGLADVVQLHVDAGQRGARARGHHVPVVKADHRDLIRDPASEIDQPVGDPAGDLV